LRLHPVSAEENSPDHEAWESCQLPCQPREGRQKKAQVVRPGKQVGKGRSPETGRKRFFRPWQGFPRLGLSPTACAVDFRLSLLQSSMRGALYFHSYVVHSESGIAEVARPAKRVCLFESHA